MEVEVTYEDFLKYYPSLKTDFTKLLPKNALPELKYTYRPPFLILHDDIVDSSLIYSNTLIDMYEMLQNEDPKFRNSSFYQMQTSFYVTKFDENYIEMKDGSDRGFIFLGPFEPKKIIPSCAIGDFNKKKLLYGKYLLALREEIKDFQQKQNK
ncbi:hypothetical protein ABPG74_008617 [Tetrahymena malaccensis]